MYVRYFGFRRRPFDLVPDPDFLFLGESHDSALANLMLGIESGKGFVVIAGGVGTGKTTILRAVLRRLGRELDVAVLTQPDLEPAELLRTILGEFGVEATGDDKVALRRQLRDFLEKRPRPAILAIDEAHLLTEESLEQVRLLSNFEEADRKLLQIVMAGQPELKELLSRVRLRPLAQRIEMFYEIQPLSPEETSAYVMRRIQIAGQPEHLVVEPRALEEIHDLTGGVPRLINVLAERALITAYVAESKTITARTVREAYADLGEVTQRVMRNSEPEEHELAILPVEPVRFARPSDRAPSPRTIVETAKPRRKNERWIAGIGLGVAGVLAIVSLGTHRALSSKPGQDAKHVESGATKAAALVAPPIEKGTPAAPGVEPLASRALADSTAALAAGEERATAPSLLPKPVEAATTAKPLAASAETPAKIDVVPPAKSTPAAPEPAKRAETPASSPAADAADAKMPEILDAPPPSVVLTREREASIRPEDVPLVDEASGSEAAAYSIQCGSFRDRDRALELTARLHESTGETGRIVPMQMSSGTWYRVLLGTFPSEAKAREKIGAVHEHDRLLVLQVVRLSQPAGSPPSAE
jgi:type II secretory pathway predicted ATPase ExeA/cell division protein FtsN